jgi:hypothetical protein
LSSVLKALPFLSAKSWDLAITSHFATILGEGHGEPPT